MTDRKNTNRTLEDSRLIFRNFSGTPGQFNAEGDRNFGVLLSPELAADLESEGFNVKFLKRREGDDPDEPQQAWLKVKVNFKSARPPKAHLITSRGKSPLGEEEVNILDFAEFVKVDLIVNPYHYEIGGKTGVTAYLTSIYATIVEDELDLKYADVETDRVDSAQSARPHFTDESEEAPY